MKEPRWLLDEAIEAIHKRQLAEHGGAAGIRDGGLLASALARPKNVFAYESPVTLARLAAEYAYGIARATIRLWTVTSALHLSPACFFYD